jgi:[ribosomal protein S5]-alanine N-acetyltransferase
MPVSDPEHPLETPRLLLEPLETHHAPALYAALQASELYTFIPRDPPATPDTLAARYKVLSSRHSPDGREDWLNWAMRHRATGAYVGTIEATVRADHTALLAYMIFPSYWLQGYAREGCSCVLAHLFEHYHVSRVAAEIDTRNAASIRLVESLGFTRVAVTPGADFFKGASSDEYRYERSAPNLLDV